MTPCARLSAARPLAALRRTPSPPSRLWILDSGCPIPTTKSVGDHGKWLRVEVCPDWETAVEWFRAYMGLGPLIENAQRDLAGRDLMCWCPLPEPGQPDHCHAAVLLGLANA